MQRGNHYVLPNKVLDCFPHKLSRNFLYREIYIFDTKSMHARIHGGRDRGLDPTLKISSVMFLWVSLEISNRTKWNLRKKPKKTIPPPKGNRNVILTTIHA